MVEGKENKRIQKTNLVVKLTTWTCLLNTGAQLSHFLKKRAQFSRFLKTWQNRDNDQFRHGLYSVPHYQRACLFPESTKTSTGGLTWEKENRN